MWLSSRPLRPSSCGEVGVSSWSKTWTFHQWLEIVVDGLSMFNGSQLAVDTTLVSPLRRDGTARPGAATRDCAALRFAQGTHVPRIDREIRRYRLVVLAGEVGGRWSAETQQFLTTLAHARAQSVPKFLKGILACTVARAFAVSLWRSAHFRG